MNIVNGIRLGREKMTRATKRHVKHMKESHAYMHTRMHA